MEEVIGQKLYPKQAEIVRTFYQNRYDPTLPQLKHLTICAGMRSGKTALASLIGAYEFFDVITIDNPSAYYGLIRNQPIFLTTVATSSKLAEDGVFYNWINYIEGCDWFDTWVDIKISDERISCVDKNVYCQVLGSWATTVAGRSNRFVAFDELDLFDQATDGRRSGWEMYATLSKSTSTFGLDGHVMSISSPKSPTGVIMTLYRRGVRDPLKTAAYLLPTWEMNPNYTKEALMEEFKHDLPSFWRDFGCQPEIAGGLQFPDGIKQYPMMNVLKSDVAPKLTTPVSRVMSIDPAVTNDSFGVATAYLNPVGDIVVDGVHKFSKTEGAIHISPREVESFILGKIIPLSIGAFVFDTWMYPNIIEELDLRYGIKAEKHIVSKEDYDMWKGLQEYPIEMGRGLQIVQDEDLKEEANNLLVRKLESGKPKVDHDKHHSKDIADCVANCIWYLTKVEVQDVRPRMILVNAW
jgi:hypothetical protein